MNNNWIYATIPSPKSEFVVICCFGNEERFPETPMLLKVSGNTLRFIPETISSYHLFR